MLRTGRCVNDQSADKPPPHANATVGAIAMKTLLKVPVPMASTDETPAALHDCPARRHYHDHSVADQRGGPADPKEVPWRQDVRASCINDISRTLLDCRPYHARDERAKEKRGYDAPFEVCDQRPCGVEDRPQQRERNPRSCMIAGRISHDERDHGPERRPRADGELARRWRLSTPFKRLISSRRPKAPTEEGA